MQGNIYKIAPSITKEEILENCEFKEIPDYASTLSYRYFMESVENYCITDWDGDGSVALYGKEVDNASLWIRNETVYFKDRFFIPFDVLHDIFGEDLRFVWYNK